MSNYVISPETREALRLAREELDRREQALAEQNRVPPRVAAFWNAPEPWIPPWRPIESAEECEERDEAQSRGCWTG
jgi:hypothetical protein